MNFSTFYKEKCVYPCFPISRTGLSDLIVSNSLSHLRFHGQRLGTSLDLKPEVEISRNLYHYPGLCYIDYKNKKI